MICRRENQYEEDFPLVKSGDSVVDGQSGRGVICLPDEGNINWNAIMNDEKYLVCGPENSPLMCGSSFGFIYTKAVGPIICRGMNNNGYVFTKTT